MRKRTVVLNIEANSTLPIKVLRKAENYNLSVAEGDELFEVIEIIQVQANVIKNGKPKKIK